MLLSKVSGTVIIELILLTAVTKAEVQTVVNLNESKVGNENGSSIESMTIELDGTIKIILPNKIDTDLQRTSLMEKIQNESQTNKNLLNAVNSSLLTILDDIKKNLEENKQELVEINVSKAKEIKIQEKLDNTVKNLTNYSNELSSKLKLIQKELKDSNDKWSAKILEIEKNTMAIDCRGPAERCDRSDYKHSPGIGFHKLYAEAKNWTEARKACENDGAHLAIIDSKAEEELLAEMVNSAITEIEKHTAYAFQAWIGAHRIGDKWITIHDQAAYQHWAKLEETQHPTNSDCASILHEKETGMASYDCFYDFAYICQL